MHQKKPSGPSIVRQSGLRRFIVGWMVALICGFLLLGGGLSVSISKLHAQMARIYFDSQSLRTNHLLESDVLAAGRFALLDKLAPSGNHRAEREVKLNEAQMLLDELQLEAQGARERALSANIVQRFSVFSQSLRRDDPHDFRQQARLDELLEALQKHRNLNQAQMTSTMGVSSRLDKAVDAWATVIIVLTATTLLLGGIKLWQRIFGPTLELEHAARTFGAGDLQTRVRVRHDDEMGQLGETFNSMAQAICDREKERLQFVATVAHDLKNPLVVIGGAAHLLERKEYNLDAEQRADWLGKISRNTKQLEAMISDLTEAVQIETGQIVLRRETFDFAALTREVVADHAATVTTHSLCCHADVACLVNADRRRMERVVTNLISNAIKYSPAGREVQITMALKGEQGIFTVRDHGVGIAPHEMETLFRPFARLERTQKMAAGTGLGLSSVKKIVEAHGGTIEMCSEVEKGTTVTVKIPLAQEKK